MTALFDDAQSRLTDVMQHIELSDDVHEHPQHPKDDEINERLKTIMDRDARYIFGLADDKQISLRTAAYLHGIERISGAMTEHDTREYFQQQPETCQHADHG